MSNQITKVEILTFCYRVLFCCLQETVWNIKMVRNSQHGIKIMIKVLNGAVHRDIMAPGGIMIVTIPT